MRKTHREPNLLVGLLAMGLILALTSADLLGHSAVKEKLRLLSEQIEKDGDNPDLYYERAEILRKHADWGEALSDYKRVRELDPDREQIDYSLGLLFQQAGMFQRSVEPLALFLDRHPTHSGALAARGRVRHALGQHLEGAADLTAALEHLPDGEEPEPQLYVDRAQALMAAPGKHHADALRGLEEGLERLGRTIPLEMEALKIEESLGNIDAVLARLQRVGESSKHPERWQVRQAEVLARAGRSKEARSKYEEVLAFIEATPAQMRLTSGMAMLVHDINQALALLKEPRTQ